MTKRITSETNNRLDGSPMLFTPAFEAFIVITRDNNDPRWDHRVEYWREKKDWAKTLPAKPKKAEGKKVPNKYYDAKYSICDGGRESYETWKPEGMDLFAEHMQDIRMARKDKNKAKYVGLEVKFLKYLQEKTKKEATKKDGSGSKKRKPGQSAEVTAEKKRRISSMAMDDDDFAVMEEVEEEEAGDNSDDDATVSPDKDNE